MTESDLAALLDVRQFTGRAPEQVREFVTEHVEPVLKIGAGYGRPEERDLAV
jgi:hypothetical protein